MGSEITGRGFWDAVCENPGYFLIIGVCVIWSTERVIKSFTKKDKKEDKKMAEEVRDEYKKYMEEQVLKNDDEVE